MTFSDDISLPQLGITPLSEDEQFHELQQMGDLNHREVQILKSGKWTMAPTTKKVVLALAVLAAAAVIFTGFGAAGVGGAALAFAAIKASAVLAGVLSTMAAAVGVAAIACIAKAQKTYWQELNGIKAKAAQIDQRTQMVDAKIHMEGTNALHADGKVAVIGQGLGRSGNLKEEQVAASDKAVQDLSRMGCRELARVLHTKAEPDDLKEILEDRMKPIQRPLKEESARMLKEKDRGFSDDVEMSLRGLGIHLAGGRKFALHTTEEKPAVRIVGVCTGGLAAVAVNTKTGEVQALNSPSLKEDVVSKEKDSKAPEPKGMKPKGMGQAVFREEGIASLKDVEILDQTLPWADQDTVLCFMTSTTHAVLSMDHMQEAITKAKGKETLTADAVSRLLTKEAKKGASIVPKLKEKLRQTEELLDYHQQHQQDLQTINNFSLDWTYAQVLQKIEEGHSPRVSKWLQDWKEAYQSSSELWTVWQDKAVTVKERMPTELKKVERAIAKCQEQRAALGLELIKTVKNEHPSQQMISLRDVSVCAVT